MANKNTITEYNKVEKPLMQQLEAMGWDVEIHPPNEEDVKFLPHLTHRENFDQVLLLEHVKAALYKLNVDDDGMQWLDEARVDSAITELQRVGKPKLMESNVAATKLLLEGVTVKGDPELHGGRDVTVRFIDFEHSERNHFLAINQFRVNPPGGVSAKNFYIPDVVLFVNGIPLVVIECKAPQVAGAMNKGIKQLLQYTNQRGSEQPEGIEPLFWYNQALISTYYNGARVSTIGASYEHYMEWKTTVPPSEDHVIQEVQTSPLMSQHKLVAGMLRPNHLIDLVRHFTLFKVDEGRTIKIVARYQQWQAVQEAIRRLREEPTRLLDGEFDRRGGIIWHTQGSGKSLSMVFLVRKLRTLPDLRQFKVVVVTDRRDLEKQLSETMQLTGETVLRATNATALKRLLQEDAPGLIFGMIQKYRRELLKERGIDDDDLEDGEDTERKIEDADRYEPLNPSTDILLLVDEAHRSHTDEWHANLLAALPNCARIGFTGTPIFAKAKQKSTDEIFGTFIDIYNIKQAEEDEVTVPILYEGREVEAGILDHSDLDQLFEKNFEQLTPEQREKIKEKHAREKEVLESTELIRTKADDILKHYISTILPNGFKAQLVAVSRLAAIRYQEALAEAHQRLVNHLERMDIGQADLPDDKIREYEEDGQYYIRALKNLDTIRRLEFAAVISSDQHDPPSYRQWSDKSEIDARIERFKKPLNHEDAGRRDGLAFLCVRTMLLTGFDAPIEQALYLDRFIQGHELLQAIARVNRTYKNKACGYVVDYYGVTNRLTEALAVYSQSDVEGALQSIREELPKLEDRFNELKAFFRENGVDDTDNLDACVILLVENERARAEFTKYFKAFLVKLDVILPRPEALPYVDEAKYFGVISRTVSNMLREEEELAIAGVGDKVRKLIDDHLRAYHVEQTVPPLSIMDVGYEQQVERQTSDRSKAAEMEHAARHEIAVKMDEDPVRYEKLSQRLEQILEELGEHWDELVEALKAFIEEMQSETDADRTADFFPERDSYRFKPFMSILLDAGNVDLRQMSDDDLQRYAGITVELIKIIQPQISLRDFWSTSQRVEELKAEVKVRLDQYDVVDYDALDACADRIVQLAKRRHTDLIHA